MVETISSQYTTRDMLDALTISERPTTFLQDMLVKGAPEEHATKYIEIDVEIAGKTMAAYVSRVGPAEVVATDGYDSKIHVLPYTKQQKILTAEDLETRLPGETVYSAGSPASRRDFLLGKWLGELEDRLTRLEEYQLADALINGTATISGNGVEYTITYGRAAGNTVTLTGNDRWGESAMDILANIRSATAQMRLATVAGGNPSALVLGTGAATNFIEDAYTADTKLNQALNMRKVETGMIDVKQLAGQKADYIGSIVDVGVNLDIYSYYETYVNSAGTEVPYVGVNDALFINPRMRVNTHYSSITNLNSSFVGARFPSSWVKQDGSSEILQLESGPLVATHEPNCCYYLNTYGGA